jgi:hypothetical protein
LQPATTPPAAHAPVTAHRVANVAIFLLQGLAPALASPFRLWPLAPSAATGGQVAFFRGRSSPTASCTAGSCTSRSTCSRCTCSAAMEQVVGSRRYLVYYVVCVITAALTQLGFAALTGDIYPTVGASGGVFGLLLAYAVYFPRNRVMLLFPPIPIPARWFVVIYAAIELFLGVTGTQSGVAHFAHLGGLVGGAAMLFYWRRG